MQDSVIERCARVIAREARAPEDIGWRCYTHYARAVLQALREHDLVVRDDAGQVVHELRGAPNDIWKHMLDGIISEQSQPVIQGDA